MTRKFDVVTTMTEEEYQSWSSGREVKLQMRTKWSDEPYTEDDVPRIVADAAAAIGILPGSFQPRKCNAREWPFGLKTAVMSAAYRNWAPGCETKQRSPGVVRRQEGRRVSVRRGTGTPDRPLRLDQGQPGLRRRDRRHPGHPGGLNPQPRPGHGNNPDQRPACPTENLTRSPLKRTMLQTLPAVDQMLPHWPPSPLGMAARKRGPDQRPRPKRAETGPARRGPPRKTVRSMA